MPKERGREPIIVAVEELRRLQKEHKDLIDSLSQAKRRLRDAERASAQQKLELLQLRQRNEYLEDQLALCQAGEEAREMKEGFYTGTELLDQADIGVEWGRHDIKSQVVTVGAKLDVPAIVVARADLAQLLYTLGAELGEKLSRELLGLYMRAHYRDWLNRGVTPQDIAEAALKGKITWNSQYQTGLFNRKSTSPKVN